VGSVILHSDQLPEFEKELIGIMIDEQCTLSQALDYAFSTYNVDTNSVFDLVDFLEERVYDLDKVQMLMMIYTSQTSDFQLVVGIIDNGEAKTKGANKG
jgi:hypothetical protein